MQKKKYDAGGRCWEVTGWEVIEGVGAFPILDMPLVSDYRWQLNALESRLRHPEFYAEEDLPATIERLRAYLEKNREAGEKEGLYQKYLLLL